MSFKCFFFVSFLSILIVGCRSSRSGSSHSELEASSIKESRNDSTDFKEKFAQYLAEQESNLKVRVIRFYPPEPGDTTTHGAVESVTDIDLSSKIKSDSTVTERQLTVVSDTTFEQSYEKTEADTTYQIKPIPWYQPFVPYLVLAFIATIIYYLRRKR